METTTFKQDAKILIIYTGGTIGMIEDPETHTLKPFNFDHLIDNVPRIKKLDFQIKNIQFDPPIDSSDMNPSHWDMMARAIEENYNDFDGFVVLHGTDTMAYTASALSFMLENLNKPVIITGSQLPMCEVRTDGEENLITALQIAAATTGKNIGRERPMVQEVAILFENYLWRGNRSTKMSADNFNAFKSNNYPKLAQIGLGIHFNEEALWRLPFTRPLNVRYGMDTNVSFIDIFPGISEKYLRYQLSMPGIKGIILRTYGAGNAPTDKWFTDARTDAVNSGIIILNVTQCPNGGVHARRYYAGDRLANAGVISGNDITSEAAVTKMMFLFGQGLEPQQVRQELLTSMCGEMTV